MENTKNEKQCAIHDVIHSIFAEYHEMSVKYIKEYERELYKVGDIDKEKLYTNRAKSDAIEECIKVLNKYCV